MQPTGQSTPTEPNGATAVETLQNVIESSREMFEAGARVISDLDRLRDRIDRATDWKLQVRTHPYFLLGAILAGSLVTAAILRRKA